MTRNATISPSEVAMPQASEASVKPVTATENSIRRPSRSASQPVSGVAMAEATI